MDTFIWRQDLLFCLWFFGGFLAVLLSMDISIADFAVIILCRSSFAVYQPSPGSVAASYSSLNSIIGLTDKPNNYSNPSPTWRGLISWLWTLHTYLIESSRSCFLLSRCEVFTASPVFIMEGFTKQSALYILYYIKTSKFQHLNCYHLKVYEVLQKEKKRTRKLRKKANTNSTYTEVCLESAVGYGSKYILLCHT